MKTFALVTAFVLISIAVYSQSREKARFEVQKTDAEWKDELGADEYKVLCGGATEPAFTGKYLYHKEKGTYTCGACKAPLFSSETKFDSGSGWPSFYDQVDKDAILEVPDYSFGMKRTEILCAKCGGHLGHVFNDGPNPTGLRYCVNSLSLDFSKDEIPEIKDER